MNMIEPASTSPLSSSHALRAGLASIGWSIEAAEIDMVNERITLVLKRNDGRWLHVSGERARATVERWQRGMVTVRTSRRSASFDACTDTFIGRVRCEGVRAALRHACNYLADNPSPGHAALPASALRALLRPAMQ